MTKSPFELWLERNRPKLIEWYCEGTMVDKDFLTRIEEFAKEAFEAGENHFWDRQATETNFGEYD